MLVLFVLKSALKHQTAATLWSVKAGNMGWKTFSQHGHTEDKVNRWPWWLTAAGSKRCLFAIELIKVHSRCSVAPFALSLAKGSQGQAAAGSPCVNGQRAISSPMRWEIKMSNYGCQMSWKSFFFCPGAGKFIIGSFWGHVTLTVWLQFFVFCTMCQGLTLTLATFFGIVLHFGEK